MDQAFIPFPDGVLWTCQGGDPAAPSVLLIAGANASSKLWPPSLIKALIAGGVRVITYDHRDTGRSTTRAAGAQPYTVGDLAEDARRVLDGFGIPKAHIVGMSLGGTIAQVLALEHPSRVQTLAVMNTAALNVDFAAAFSAALEGRVNPCVPAGLPGPNAEVVRKLGEMLTPGEDLDSELDRRVEQWRLLSGPEIPFDANSFREREMADISHTGRIAPPTAHFSITPYKLRDGRLLKHIEVATLVIQAGQDPLNPPPHGRFLAEQLPSGRLAVIEKMGHALSEAVIPDLSRLLLSHIYGQHEGPCPAT